MNELGPKARALIERSRPALRPTAADRERIEAALRAKLGSETVPEIEPHSQAAAPVSSSLLTGATLAVLLLGAVTWRVFTPEPSPPSRPAPIVASPAAPAELPASETPSPAELPTGLAPPASSKPPAKTAPSNSQDRLALEVSLLSRATRALRAGRADEALRTLEEHQHKFPKGALSQERRIAKAQALCSLGRVLEGRAELERLPKNSPATVRAEKACDL